LIEQGKQANLLITNGFTVKDVPDIILTGNQQNVFKYLNGASLYLMNSSSEGFPNGMIEAMICGVPVISSDCPYGPREILAPELNNLQQLNSPYLNSNGILMPLQNSEIELKYWVNTIISILANNELRSQIGQKGKSRAHDFGREEIIPQWLKILHD
jgi:glycosyltransferase involved in cell wall biosynthesis